MASFAFFADKNNVSTTAVNYIASQPSAGRGERQKPEETKKSEGDKTPQKMNQRHTADDGQTRNGWPGPGDGGRGTKQGWFVKAFQVIFPPAHAPQHSFLGHEGKTRLMFS